MPAAGETTKIIFWLGESLGFWIQTGAFFMSALGAVWVIRANGKQARNRATIDLVLHQRADQELNDARHIVVKLHRDGETNLARYLADPECDIYKAMQVTLNNYEFIASGIREGAFDEHIFKRMRYSTTMRDWEALNGLIVEIRRVRRVQTLFQEFEWLCNKWEKQPLKKGPPNFFRQLFTF